jgi:hypothetical protein
MSTNTFTFAPASRAQAKARIALDGPSGSGKTYTALSIAEGLGGQIGVIDTERGSASKYAPPFAFLTLPMYTYDPRDLPKALAAAAGAGIEVLIIDSLSHFWMGTGGMLEQVDKFAKRNTGGNSFAAWKDAKPLEREMIEAILAYPGHVIVTMRTKTEWVITEDDRGKKAPKKLGTKAEQRDGIEYEFDIVGDLDIDHNMVISKSRVSELADQVISRPAQPLGQQIKAWLAEGTALPDVSQYIDQVLAAASRAEAAEVYRAVMARNLAATPCLSPAGEPTNLGALIIARGHELADMEAKAQNDPAAVFNTPPAPAPAGPPAAAHPTKPQWSHPTNGQPPADPWATPVPAQLPVPAEQPITAVPLATDAQLKTMHTALTNHGLAKPADRLAYCSKVVGRPLNSTHDLTWTEARRIAQAVAQEPKPNTIPAAEQAGPDDDHLFADLRAGMEGASSEPALDEVYGRAQNAVQAGTLSPGRLDALQAVGMQVAEQLRSGQAVAA